LGQSQVEVFQGFIVDTLTTTELNALPNRVKIKGAYFHNRDISSLVTWNGNSWVGIGGNGSLPSDSGAASGDALVTDGSGNLSWENIDDSNVESSFAPGNYTPSASTLRGQLQGIDSAFDEYIDRTTSQSIQGPKEFNNGVGNQIDIIEGTTNTISGYGGPGDNVFRAVLSTNVTGFMAQKTVGASGHTPFVYKNESGVDLFSVDESGNVSGNSFALIGGDGSNVLLDDGSTTPLSGLGGGGVTLPIDATDVSDGSVTNTEFGYLNNLVSPIQQQLDSKVNISGASMAGSLSFGDTYKITDLADPTDPQDGATKAYVDANAGGGITSDITGLTGATSFSNAYIQTEEGRASDGAVAAGDLPFISNAAPATIETAGATTIDVSGQLMVMMDNRDDDSASITLNNMKEGHLVIIYVDQATEPSITASGWTVTPVTETLDWTTDSLANTDLVLYLFAQGDGIIDKTWRKR
jgi:hypothetical protein